MSYLHLSFSKSAPSVQLLPKDIGREVIMVGYSNVGKSSLINAISNTKGLAKFSKTPGRTRLFNVFNHTQDQRVLDLPGFGFAKVPKSEQARWMQEIQSYLSTRKSLQGIVVIMDIRHPFKTIDQDVLSWAHDHEIPTLVVLNKADKLPQHKVNATIARAYQTYNLPKGHILSCSCSKKKGVAEISKIIQSWLGR